MQNTISLKTLIDVEPLTDNQQKTIEAYNEGYMLGLIGSAGTGKTFLACYLAIQDLVKSKQDKKIMIIRSAVPTREIGYLKGSYEEKIDQYTRPYRTIFNELFQRSDAFEQLCERGIIEFESTSFLRGDTYDDKIIIVDEIQNMTFHELDTIMTRIGLESRIMFVGDYKQSDLKQEKDRQGIHQFLSILESMAQFSIVEFGWEDIVRSDLVRDYIMTKEFLEKENDSKR